MNNVVALVVMLGWVGVGAWLIAGRRSERVGDSMGDFKNQLGTLERRTPTTSLSHKRDFPDDPTAPRDLHEAGPKAGDGSHDDTRNRAEILFGLLFGAVLCGLLGTMSVLRLLWIAAGAFLIAALTYGALWWSSAAEKRRKAEMDAWFGPRGHGPAAQHQPRQMVALPATSANGYYDEHGNWWQAQQAYDMYGRPVYDGHGQPVYQYAPVAQGGHGHQQQHGSYGQAGHYQDAAGYQQAGQYQYANGYDAEGFDVYGYDAGGYDRYGYDREGFDVDGYDAYGYDREGYDRDGYPFEANDDEEYELFWAGRGQQWQNAQVYNLNDWRPEYRQAANY